MRALGRTPPGIIFGVALLVVASLMFSDVLVTEFAQESVSLGGRRQILEDRIVSIRPYQASPGDVLRVFPQVWLEPPIASHDFYIVESGEGVEFLENRTPRHVYVEQKGFRPVDRIVYDDYLHFRRPTPPPGYDSSTIDLVWIFYFDPAAQKPSSPEGQFYYNALLNATVSGATAFVTQSWSVTYHNVATPLIYVGGLVAAVSGFFWARELLGRAAPKSAGPAESGLALIELGGRFLRLLRALLWGFFPVLVLLTWFGLFLFWNITNELAGPTPEWGNPLKHGVVFVMAFVFAAWGVALYTVSRLLAGWRRSGETPPLEP